MKYPYMREHPNYWRVVRLVGLIQRLECRWARRTAAANRVPTVVRQERVLQALRTTMLDLEAKLKTVEGHDAL